MSPTDVAADRPAAATSGPGNAVRLDVACRGLSKHFGDTVAVDAIDLEVRCGEFFSLLGPSGCGKSTTLRMIAGLERPTDGTIHLRGVDVTRQPPNRRATSLVFQQGALFPHMTVFENVAFGLEAERVPRADVRRRVDEMLQVVNLEELRDRRPSQLSGGQAQRAAIARSLVKRPAVLLLDEPLSALDLKLQVHMRRELKQLQHRVGTTFVCVTHNQAEALEMSDRLAVMDSGRVAQVGSGREIYEQPASRFVAAFIGETNFLEGRVRSVEGPVCLVHAEGLDVRVDRRGRPASGTVTLSLRPEAVEVGEATSALPNRYPAVVREVRYLGSSVRYQVELSGGRVLAVEARTQRVHTPGDRVLVGWEATAAVLLADELEAATTRADAAGGSGPSGD